MKYQEITKDLFTMSEDYKLAHCIATDAMMGAGIAVDFARRFPNIIILRKDWEKNEIGSCHLIGRVLNLMTKRRSWEKPRYIDLTKALIEMREICLSKNITKVAMPLIGCGLDRLRWSEVKLTIQNIFQETDIEIVICMKEDDR